MVAVCQSACIPSAARLLLLGRHTWPLAWPSARPPLAYQPWQPVQPQPARLDMASTPYNRPPPLPTLPYLAHVPLELLIVLEHVAPLLLAAAVASLEAVQVALSHLFGWVLRWARMWVSVDSVVLGDS